MAQAAPVDPSVELLGLPSSRSRLGKWGVVAIVAGAILAMAVMMILNYQF
jgi:riboflavin transporter FmnP